MDKIFSVYDLKAQAYLPLFTAPTIAVGMRVFSDVVTQPGHIFGKYHADYMLYCVGDFDQATGRVTPCDPQHVAIATDFIKEA